MQSVTTVLACGANEDADHLPKKKLDEAMTLKTRLATGGCMHKPERRHPPPTPPKSMLWTCGNSRPVTRDQDFFHGHLMMSSTSFCVERAYLTTLN